MRRLLASMLAWLSPPAPRPGPPAIPRARPRVTQRAVPIAAPTVAGRLDSLINRLSALGGSNDKGAAGQVDLGRGPLAPGELDQLLRYNGYARRIVDIVASDATRRGWTVVDSTRDADPFKEEDKRLQVQARMRAAMQIARTYGGCNVLMMVEETPRTNPITGAPIPPKLSDPLDLDRVVRVANLIPLDVIECTALTWDTDPSSENYRRPLLWNVSPQSGGISSLVGKPVHWTRMLYIPGKELPDRLRVENRGYDMSVLQAAWDAVRNLTTVDQAGATHSQELSIPVLKMADMRAMSASEQATALQIRTSLIAQARSLLNMILLGPDEEYEHREISLGGFDKVAERAKEALCAAVDMPVIVLFGEAPGGLNTDGSSGRTLWDRVVAAEQQRALAPGLTRMYRTLYRAKAGPTGGQEPAEWEVCFNGLDEPGDMGKLNLQKAAAEVDKLYLDMGVVTAEQIRATRFGPKGWSLDMLPAPTAPTSPDSATATAPGAPPPPNLLAADLPIRVQIPAGDIRRGIGEDGQPWMVRLPCDYGELRGTRDLDGEPTDILHVPGGPRGMAFVYELLMPADAAEGGDDPADARADAADQIDEHKVVIGCATEAAARAVLDQVYPAGATWGRYYAVPEAQLLAWLAAHVPRAGANTDAIDFSPPEGVREELRRGLAWHEEGKSGSGLVPATVRWARRLARGEAITPAKAKKMRAWLARHEVDKQGEGYKPGDKGFPSPGRVAWALWGGDPAVTWSNKIVEQLERAAKA